MKNVLEELRSLEKEVGSVINETELIICCNNNGNYESVALEEKDFKKTVYDSGYGSQKLYGTVWFEDGTWADRCEFDGSEWWEHRVRPSAPSERKEIKE